MAWLQVNVIGLAGIPDSAELHFPTADAEINEHMDSNSILIFSVPSVLN